jgi:hypothetical protein
MGRKTRQRAPQPALTTPAAVLAAVEDKLSGGRRPVHHREAPMRETAMSSIMVAITNRR